MTAPLTRLTAPFAWGIPGRDARLFHAFALAEHGSSLDLRAASEATTSPVRRAKYLRHALDEARHARLFGDRSAELRRARDLPPIGPVTADFEWLFETLGEAGFLAFVVRGERRASRQFEVHHAWFVSHGRQDDARMFVEILRDEAQHERYAWKLLVELSGSESHAHAAMRKAAVWEWWRTWRRAGRWLANYLYAAMMVLLYVTLLPMALLLRWVRPVRAGWQWVLPEKGA